MPGPRPEATLSFTLPMEKLARRLLNGDLAVAFRCNPTAALTP